MSHAPWDLVSWTPNAARDPRRTSRFAPLDGCAPLALRNPTGAKWTRQSSVGAPFGLGLFTRPTRAEQSPWWAIDLGAVYAIERLCARIADVPAGTVLTVRSYSYAAIDGGPPHNAPAVTFELDRIAPAEAGERSIDVPLDMVARFVRIELSHPRNQELVLDVRAFDLDATDLYDDTLKASYARAFTRFADRTLFSKRAVDGEGPFVPLHTYRSLWSESLALAAALARRLERALTSPDARPFLALIVGQRPEWFAAELAAVQRGYVVVPLAPDDSDERLRAIFAGCPMDAALCDADVLPRLLALDGAPTWLVCVDPVEDRPEFQGRVLSYRAMVREPLGGVPLARTRGERDLHSLIFTSGSTGTPKGAMRAYESFNRVIQSYGAGQPLFHLSFQPLSHLSERNYLPCAVLNGAHVGLSAGGAHVLSDIEAFEPTWVASVPRLFEAVHAVYCQQLEQARAEHPDEPAAQVEQRVLAQTRARFGRQLQGVSVGSAPVSDEILRFMKTLFEGLWVQSGYGSTEAGTISNNDQLSADVRVKIVPIPEDAPAPAGVLRGELWVQTPHVFDGYFNEPALTEASLDRDGYFRTGDIVERYLDHSIRVVGRRSSSVKLASGEFVALDHIEAVLAAHPLVQSVFASLDRRKRAVVIVLVAHEAALRSILNTSDSIQNSSIESERAASAAVLAALRQHGVESGLRSWELPSAVLFHHEPFSVESGLLTASMKLARPVAERRFRAALDGLEPEERPASVSDTPLGRALSAASAVVGRAVGADDPLHTSVARDSLQSAELIAAVGRVLRRPLSLREWSSAPTLAALVERASARESSSLIELVRADVERESPAVFQPVRADASVLLTGATGFIGAHVLEALCDDGRAVHCLVRAESERAGRERVLRTLARYGVAVDEARVSVRALPSLDALDRTLDGLAVGAVVHCAAAVNWLSAYELVRESNVALTDALIAWCAREGAEMQHVSTVSCAPADGDESSAWTIERAAQQSGYGASKWVAERRVARAFERGLRGAIHRPGLVTGHSARGLGNRDDFVHRYLAACARYGVGLDGAARLDMTPADYVARAIVACVQREDAYGRVLHLNNVRGAMTFAALTDAIDACGARCEPVSWGAFVRRAVEPDESPLRPLMSYFAGETNTLGSGPWPDGRTREWLALRSVRCPAIDAASVARALRGLGLIP